jgi:hypothetical protein
MVYTTQTSRKIQGTLAMVYKTQNCWVLGLHPSYGILKTRGHFFPKTGTISVLRCVRSLRYSYYRTRDKVQKPRNSEHVILLLIRTNDSQHTLWIYEVKLEVSKHEDGVKRFFRKAGTHLRNYAVSQ